MEQEFGRIKKTDRKEIVIRKDDYKGETGITIREFIRGEKFQGFTKNGTRVPLDKWQEFKTIVNNIN